MAFVSCRSVGDLFKDQIIANKWDPDAPVPWLFCRLILTGVPGNGARDGHRVPRNDPKAIKQQRAKIEAYMREEREVCSCVEELVDAVARAEMDIVR